MRSANDPRRPVVRLAALEIAELFEMYADSCAYDAHIASAHFRKYEVGTEVILKSLVLHETDPICSGRREATFSTWRARAVGPRALAKTDGPLGQV
jgi:hypothetical protein